MIFDFICELAVYEKLLKKDPANSLTWSNRGYALVKTGRIQDAIKSFDRALELDPNNMDAKYGKFEAIRIMWPSYVPDGI